MDTEEKEVDGKKFHNGIELTHLRSLGRGGLRWRRRNVITVAGCLFRIGESVIVRRPVPLRARS